MTAPLFCQPLPAPPRLCRWCSDPLYHSGTVGRRRKICGGDECRRKDAADRMRQTRTRRREARTAVCPVLVYLAELRGVDVSAAIGAPPRKGLVGGDLSTLDAGWVPDDDYAGRIDTDYFDAARTYVRFHFPEYAVDFSRASDDGETVTGMGVLGGNAIWCGDHNRTSCECCNFRKG